MSGSYRLQPPSPFPYSGGSRMEQSLVPGLNGPNSNSMLGYVLGAQLQRQADQMNYEGEMDNYNLTAQQEAGNARQEMLADRAEQRTHALTAAAVNSGGPGFLPESYSLTPQQRQLASADAEARTALRTAQAERAGRAGTGGGGSVSARPDPMLIQDVRAIDTQLRTAQAGLNALPGRRAQLERSLQTIFNPAERAAAQARINEQMAAEEQRLNQQVTALQARRQQVRAPNATQPQAPAQPVPTGEAPSSPPTSEVAPQPTTPRTGANPAALPADRLARARALAAQTGGTPGTNSTGEVVVRMPDGSIRRVD